MAEPSINAKLVIDTSQLQGLAGGINIGGGGAPAAATGNGGGALAGAAGSGGAARGAAAGGIGAFAKLAGPLAAIAVGVVALKKVFEKLVASSPRLQQEVARITKALQLFLRPIADFVASLLRPLAIALLRLAVNWNRWMKDNPIILPTVKEAVSPTGVTTTTGQAKLLGDLILEALARVGAWFRDVWWPTFKQRAIDIKNWFVNVWWPTFKERWGLLKAFIVDKVIAPVIEKFNLIKTWWIESFIPFILGKWEELKEWWGPFKTRIINSWNEIKTNFNEKVKQPILDAWKAIREFSLGPLGTLEDVFLNIATAIGKIISAAMKLINLIPGINIGNADNGNGDGLSSGPGGRFDPVLGRRVGDNEGGSNGSGMRAANFSPTININANIDSDQDIERLANKLAERMHNELRRSISFSGVRGRV